MQRKQYNEDVSSVFKLKPQIVASIPYILLLIYRFMSNTFYIINIGEISDADIMSQIVYYVSTYISFTDFFIALIPLAFIVVERKSEMVLYHSFQFVIMTVIIPFIYIVGVWFLSWFSIFNNMIFAMIMMFIYGLIGIVMTCFMVFILFDIYYKRSSNIPFISRMTEKVTDKYLKFVK
ncbi:MAG: hypothetical protein PUC68_00880 [Firmicutes bacterium]|nr:hypothetical protein [Bacillota bacterium]